MLLQDEPPSARLGMRGDVPPASRTSWSTLDGQASEPVDLNASPFRKRNVAERPQNSGFSCCNEDLHAGCTAAGTPSRTAGGHLVGQMS